VMEVREVHEEKAAGLMVLTEVGMVMEVREEQEEKA
jgi:hypothetical protein